MYLKIARAVLLGTASPLAIVMGLRGIDPRRKRVLRKMSLNKVKHDAA